MKRHFVVTGGWLPEVSKCSPREMGGWKTVLINWPMRFYSFSFFIRSSIMHVVLWPLQRSFCLGEEGDHVLHELFRHRKQKSRQSTKKSMSVLSGCRIKEEEEYLPFFSLAPHMGSVTYTPFAATTSACILDPLDLFDTAVMSRL